MQPADADAYFGKVLREARPANCSTVTWSGSITAYSTSGPP